MPKITKQILSLEDGFYFYLLHTQNLKKILYKDGSEFVREEAEKGNKYDGLIIDNTDVDLTDESNNVLASVLFSIDFFKVSLNFVYNRISSMYIKY